MNPKSVMPPSFPPDWACAWGSDSLSPYPCAELQLAPGLTTRLRWLPPGTFLMGSPEAKTGRFDDEGPQHRVELTRGFWIGETPCTQAEWEAVMGTNPSGFKGDTEESRQRPVESVNWEDCQEFCRKLNERVGGLGARLPTEAEWEYACRAGSVSAYNDGSDCTEPEGADPALQRLGWFYKNSEGTTHPVRQLAPNAWGLSDLHGNAFEWCADLWSGKYQGGDAVNPTGPADGLNRVVRGGCWSSPAKYCRSACRDWRLRVERRFALGFRFAAGLVGPASGKEQAR